MRAFLLPAAILATVWTFSTTAALVLLALMVFAYGTAASRNPLPRPPAKPKTHRWVPGFGLGLTPHGPFPFVTIYRRRR